MTQDEIDKDFEARMTSVEHWREVARSAISGGGRQYAELVEARAENATLKAGFEKLLAENARLTEALKPFAAVADESTRDFGLVGDELMHVPSGRPDNSPAWGFNRVTLTWGDFNRARAALGQSEDRS